MDNGGLMLRVVTLAAALVAAAACADEDPLRQYTFSWPYSAADEMRPRGGTTTGAAVELLEGASPQWEAVQEPGLTAFERDRRAIVIEGGMQNSGLALGIIAVQFNADLGMVVIASLWGIWHIVSGLALGVFWRNKDARLAH